MGGQPRLLVVVSNQEEANQHLGKGLQLSCTDYDLPTDVELSVILTVFEDTARVYIDGVEVISSAVGARDARELEVIPNPADEGWIAGHGYEVPNVHASIREVYYVAFPGRK